VWEIWQDDPEEIIEELHGEYERLTGKRPGSEPC
jgi:hypothetical protein